MLSQNLLTSSVTVKMQTSSMNALIGSHGVVGQSLRDHMSFDLLFDSDNIAQLPGLLDTVIVAAPSGNRLAVNQGKINDKACCDAIVSAIQHARPKHVVLLGSVDSVTAPDTEYGKNRHYLETALVNIAPTTVIRLCTLIGCRIKKNMLYDIKHRQFLNKINSNAWLQWCLLDDLPRLIDQTQPGVIVDLVSEPIQNSTVIQRYVPNLQVNSKIVSIYYNQRPYAYSQQQIFTAMDRYML